MKILYLECNMGAAGDMLMAALLELHENPKDFLERLNNAGIPNVIITTEACVKHGIRGTHVRVAVNGEEESADYHGHEHIHTNTHECGDGHGHSHEDGHSHSHEDGHSHSHSHGHEHNDYHSIGHIIGHLNVSNTVKQNAVNIYRLIAEAEGHVHGVTVDKIHFHEVGAMDAVADIVGCCMLMEELGPDMVLASAVNTGKGYVRCSHGVLPVPAPATAYLLQNVPVFNDEIRGELCTPTGAALLKYFVKEFCNMPVTSIKKTGYGMGKKDFDKVNCVRAFMGNTKAAGEEVIELICNLDDMTPEALAFARQILLDKGALDAYTVPIGMKKGRPGYLLICMSRLEEKEGLLSLIFKHTSTLGIREYRSIRHTLKREEAEIETRYGKIRIKTSYGYGTKKVKPEYEDISRIAEENDKSLNEILSEIKMI